jgi:hypothetical protein
MRNGEELIPKARGHKLLHCKNSDAEVTAIRLDLMS